mgnify:CR=1 FL=1
MIFTWKNFKSSAEYFSSLLYALDNTAIFENCCQFAQKLLDSRKREREAPAWCVGSSWLIAKVVSKHTSFSKVKERKGMPSSILFSSFSSSRKREKASISTLPAARFSRSSSESRYQPKRKPPSYIYWTFRDKRRDKKRLWNKNNKVKKYKKLKWILPS